MYVEGKRYLKQRKNMKNLRYLIVNSILVGLFAFCGYNYLYKVTTLNVNAVLFLLSLWLLIGQIMKFFLYLCLKYYVDNPLLQQSLFVKYESYSDFKEKSLKKAFPKRSKFFNAFDILLDVSLLIGCLLFNFYFTFSVMLAIFLFSLINKSTVNSVNESAAKLEHAAYEYFT